MTFRHERDSVLWIDLERPSAEEVRAVAKELEIGRRLEEELLTPSPLPIVLSESGAALITLHFPTEAGEGKDFVEQEVDIIVGKGFILTVSYEVIPGLHQLRKQLEAQQALEPKKKVATEGILYLIMRSLFGGVRDYATHAADRLVRIQNDMMGGKERSVIARTSSINREFLHLEAAIALHEEPLSLFLNELTRSEMLGSAFEARKAHILAERTQVDRLLAKYRALATELRELNMVVISAAQNEAMRTLTVMSVVMLPLSLIAVIFAMRTEGMPFVNEPNGFWIVTGLMAVVFFALMLFFAHKKWL